MTKLPDLASKYTKLLHQRRLQPDDSPLSLEIEHGRRKFKVTLKIPEKENGDQISMRHLAEMVLCETGIIPREQKYYYKGMSFENPDLGPWSPALKDLGIKNGDKIQLVSFHKPFPDWENMQQLEDLEKQIHQIREQENLLFYHLQGSEKPRSDFHLQGLYEGHNFSIHLHNSAGVTVADLAHTVYSLIGIEPQAQRIVYKGIVFDPPDTDKWAPLLDDLNFKNGGLVQVFHSARSNLDDEQTAAVQEADILIQKLVSDLDIIEVKKNKVHSGFLECGNQVMALTYLRKDFDGIKEKLLTQIQILNSLQFDHRNSIGQAKRRELVDYCQRQVDKCSDMAATIFHKLAQAHYLANTGKLFPRDVRLSPSRNKWPKKQGL